MPKEIKLDYNIDKELFNTTAEDWAKVINGTKKTQVRGFYDKILDLEKQIKEDGFNDVYPFIKMLNSKVAYGVTRKVINDDFQKMMTQCLEQITADENGKEKFRVFKLFFESVLGFYKEKK